MSTLESLRRFLLAILLIGMTGTAVELLLLQHDEGPIQLVPLVLLGVGLVTILWHASSPGRRSTAAARMVMGAFIAAGVFGVFFHFRANAEFQLESDPTLAGAALAWKVMAAKVPPALAPGVMLQLGLLGLAYTYRTKEQ